jgi:hypothetical protein
MQKDYDLWFYQYVIAWMMIDLNKSVVEEIADTDCVMSLIEINYLITIVSKTVILKMPTLINVRSIENALHQSFSYVMLDLYLNEMCNDKKAWAHIRRESHIVNDLKCRLLMSLNIMTFKEMIINLVDKSLIISICENIAISIKINSKSNFRTRRIVHSKESVTVSLNSIISVLIYMRERKLSINRDFLFEPNHDVFTASLKEMSNLYTHVCDCNLAFVHVRNKLSKSVIISSKTRLSILIEYEEKECF